MATSGGNGSNAGERLVDSLKAVLASSRAGSDEERRSVLRAALSQSLAGLSVRETQDALEQARATLVAEARNRERRTVELDARATRAEAECASLRAERDDAMKELDRLRSSPGDGVPGRSTVDKVREALASFIGGTQPSTADFTSQEDQLFRFTRLLLEFWLRYEFALVTVKMQLTGQASDRTTVGEFLERQVKAKILACLRREPQGDEALQAKLEESVAFLSRINEAYGTAIRRGTRAIFRDFDPAPIKERHRGAMGTRWDDAWKEIVQLHTRISETPSEDIWDQYYKQVFQKTMKGDAARDSNASGPKGQ